MPSFVGFDTALDRDSQRFSQDEDLAVYTFGEEGYDDLAAQLDENLDDLNDETFGDTGTLCTCADTCIRARRLSVIQLRSGLAQQRISTIPRTYYLMRRSLEDQVSFRTIPLCIRFQMPDRPAIKHCRIFVCSTLLVAVQ